MIMRLTGIVLALFLVGCSGRAPDSGDVTASLSVDPEPPQVGSARVTVTLTDSSGDPVSGATVDLEGTMTHAGMVPTFAQAQEVSPGSYEASLEFTMGGDWVIIVRGTLADGSSIEQQFDVPGVTME